MEVGSVPVKVIPLGKKTATRRRKREPDPKMTTVTALAWPGKPPLVPSADGDRRPVQERIEAAERADMLSVALSQPHRRGSDDPRASEPLWQFCRVQRLRDELYAAGERYGEIVRQAKAALGFRVPGLVAGEGERQALSEAQSAALRELARQYFDDANAILRRVMPRLPVRMEMLCYDARLPAPADEGVIIHGLVALAIEWGLLRSFARSSLDNLKSA